jgi:hypothetical protein
MLSAHNGFMNPIEYVEFSQPGGMVADAENPQTGPSLTVRLMPL